MAKWTDMFKDDKTKEWSFSRVSAAIVLLFCLVFTGYVVYKSATMPDIQTGWLSYILGAYGINKITSNATAGKD